MSCFLILEFLNLWHLLLNETKNYSWHPSEWIAVFYKFSSSENVILMYLLWKCKLSEKYPCLKFFFMAVLNVKIPLKKALVYLMGF